MRRRCGGSHQNRRSIILTGVPPSGIGAYSPPYAESESIPEYGRAAAEAKRRQEPALAALFGSGCFFLSGRCSQTEFRNVIRPQYLGRRLIFLLQYVVEGAADIPVQGSSGGVSVASFQAVYQLVMKLHRVLLAGAFGALAQVVIEYGANAQPTAFYDFGQQGHARCFI